jgi:iron complex outermembrane receptor protein
MKLTQIGGEMKLSKHIFNGLSLVALAALVLPFNTFSAEEDESITIEEITVTARKRAESAQSVPIAITSITEQLQQSEIRNLTDLNGYAPNVTIGASANRSRASAINIRGIAYSETDKSFDSPVAVTLDGVFIGTSSGQLIENFDVERVEILRGPQGTLFGRNTVGGVINVVRSKPTGEFGGELRIAGGEFGRQELKGFVNAAISDTISAKFFYNSMESDGYMTNVFLNKDGPAKDYENIGLALLMDLGESTEAHLTIETYDDASDVGAATNLNNPTDHLVCGVFGPIIAPGSPTCATDVANPKKEYSTEENNPGQYDTDAVTLTVTHDINDDTRFVYVMGYRDEEDFTNWDLDGTAAAFTTIKANNTFDQLSHEFRFEGSNESVDYVVGAYLWENEYTQYWDTYHLWQYLVPGLVDGSVPLFLCQNAGALGALRCDPNVEGPGLGPGFLQKLYQHQEVNAQSLFGSIDWKLSDKTTLTTGLRYTREEKEFWAGQAYFTPLSKVNVDEFANIQGAGTDGPGLFNLKLDWTETSPTVVLAHQAHDDLMYYASHAQGFHSGGFFGRNQNAVDFANTYEPEYANSTELGFKSEWMDNTLQLNVAYFMNKFEDKQDSAIKQDPSTQTVVTVIGNIANVDYSGLEVELRGIVNANFTWFATLGTLDAEYDGFISDLDGADINGDLVLTNNDYLTPKFAPELNYSLGGTYSWTMGSADAAFNLKHYYVDEQESSTDNNPLGRVSSIRKTDVSLDIVWESNRLSFFVRNLGDEITTALSADIAPLMAYGSASMGKDYGVEFNMRF